jgi:outer membrane receptor protein involved in Fe transport
MANFTRRASVLVLMLLCGFAAWGQLSRGYISGTVTDSSGAVIANADVSIINVDTNIRRSAKTNEVGLYRFPAVEPGRYMVEFASSGFATRRVGPVEVGATQEVVLNQSLEVASATTTLEVVAAPAGVELSKATASIERKLDVKVLENLPLTGATRDVNQIALLAPTAARGPGSTGISANGQRARNNNFMIDGVDNNDPSVTISNNRIIPEAISEYQVQTAAYSAEYGRNSGAQIMVTTRSGTNEFHGSVFNYYRANWVEPVSLINKRAGVNSTPRFNQNQAGGSLGGPIRKDRTFFFALIEANRRREAPDARNAAVATIPTAEGYQLLRNVPLGADQTPASRQAILGGIRFLEEIYPRVTRYTNPRNVSVNGVSIPVGQIQLPLANPYNFWYGTARVDHALTSKDALTYRLQVDQRTQPNVTSNLQFGSLFAASQEILRQNHAASWTRTFSPRWVNEFRFAYIRGFLDFPENDPRTPTTGITGFFTIGGLSNFPQGRLQNSYQFQNTSTYLWNRHSIKVGADVRYNKLFNNAAFDSKGTYTFDNLQDFLNNRPAAFRQALNTATFDARQWNTFLFFQDDWRVTPELTLNLGLRYEVNTVPFGFFGAANDAVAAVGVPRDVRMDRNNWAPRAGFAYSPTGKGGWLGKLLGDGQTVFRGGWGMGYDVLFFNILTVNASNFPRVVVGEVDRTGLVNQWPNLLPVSATPRLDPFATFVNSPTDMQHPTTRFYSFSVQRQFLRNYVFELGYSGSSSYAQIRQGQANPGILTAEQAARVLETRNPNSIPGLLPTAAFPVSRRLNPAWGSRVLIESTAKARYDAMFLKLDRRLANGLTIGGNYTWSANYSDNDESLGVADIVNSSPQVPQDFFNYRNEWSRSVFDRPHRVATYWNYDLPNLLPAWNNGFARRLGKGWSFTGTADFQSGQPFTVRTGVDTGGTGTPAPHRPDYNPNGTLTLDPVTNNWRTFTTPITGGGIFLTNLTTGGTPLANSKPNGGNLGRNTFRGPGFRNWSVAALKTTDITERFRLQLRADWINAFNHRNFGNPIAVMSSPQFGQNVTDPGGRTMLLSAKILF